MKTITDILSKRLPHLIVFTAILTYYLPVYWETYTWVPAVLLGMVIFFAGLSINLDSIKGIGRKKKAIGVAVILKWTLTVTISLVLAYLFFSEEPEILAGIILSGTVPNATAATLYTFLAGGNTALVIVGSFLDTALSPVVTLLAMVNIPGKEVSITFLDLLQSFLFIVILPLAAGIFMQRMFPQSVQHSQTLTKLGSSLSLLIIVHIIVGEGKEAVAAHLNLLPLLIVVILIQVLLPMGVGYLTAKKIGVEEPEARAILFYVGLCNTALAAILAFQFIGELGAVPPIINTIINLSFGSFISNFLKKEPA
ncbi:bile acid:sodium symporter family protein [Bacillus piscicola]|uniref:bile acid:sodium symporter family protein n=1 Tax=Bacillus piscicola TaxID=1632684 RepID=UPI001F092AE8|nr:bile acid:sodium symporter [Bacillus piscicola]